jgi:hypothetical protein
MSGVNVQTVSQLQDNVNSIVQNCGGWPTELSMITTETVNEKDKKKRIIN